MVNDHEHKGSMKIFIAAIFFSCFLNYALFASSDYFLSFIVPTYNRAHTICAAIDSIYAQTNLKIPWEVVVTDDASTDNTIAILQAYKNRYENFFFYVHEHNLGPSKARNTCIAHARGDLLFNLDSDNILEPDSVQQLVDVLDELDVQAVAFGHVRFFKTPGEFAWAWCLKSTNGVCTLSDGLQIKRSAWLLGNYLFTRASYERAGCYRGRALETWRFGLRQLLTGTEVVIVPNTYYWHRISPDGNLRRGDINQQNARAAIKEFNMYKDLFTPETQELIRSYTRYEKFFTDVRHNKFKLLPDEQLREVLEKYRAQSE